MPKKPNPLSNPEDRKLWRSKVASQNIAKRWEKARLRSPMSDKTPDISKAPRIRSKYRRTPRSEIEYGPMKAWMQRFILWLVQQEKVPPIDVQVKHLNWYSKLNCSPYYLRMLLRREDVQRQMEEYQHDVIARCKAEYEELYPLMIQGQRQMLETAIANNDFRQAKHIITQGMDRLMPKKLDTSGQSKDIHIHLGGTTQQSKLMAAAHEEIVVLPEPQVTVTKLLPSGESE